MMGRAAYQEPWRLLTVDPQLFGVSAPFADAKAAAAALIPYIERELARGVRLHAITPHVLGLFRGVPGARAFRRHLATEAVKPAADAATFRDALALVPDTGPALAQTAAALTLHSEPAMILGVPIGELLWLAFAVLIGGIVSGILAGLFGIGGGAIVVPVLFEVFRLLGVPEAVLMQLCIGTSLAIMAPTNVRSYVAHRASGAVLEDVVWRWAPLAVVGTAVGSVIAAFA